MKGDTDKARVLTGTRVVLIRDYPIDHFQVDDTRIRTMGEGKTPDTRSCKTIAGSLAPEPSRLGSGVTSLREVTEPRG